MTLKGVGTRTLPPLRRSGPLQEPDLVVTVAVGGVGVAGHDERVVDAHAGGVQELRHGVDLVDDGHLVRGAGEWPGRSKIVKNKKTPHSRSFLSFFLSF